jgi:hypothetical protein
MPRVFTPSAIKSVVAPSVHATQRHDVWTVSSIAVVVYALASLLHEGIGHGVACSLVHGVPVRLSSLQFTCGLPLNAPMAERIVAAGGTVATLLGGTVALLLYQFVRLPASLRYALWLFAAVNLMQGLGYFLYSGVFDTGEWATVLGGLELRWLWRIGFVVGGLALYVALTRLLFWQIEPFVGEARPRRYENALRLATRAYLVGGGLAIIAGAFNPAGLELVMVSAVAAAFVGTSGLAWGPQMLKGTRTPSAKLEEPVILVRRSRAIVAIAITIGLLFIAMMGPGLELEEQSSAVRVG